MYGVVNAGRAQRCGTPLGEGTIVNYTSADSGALYISPLIQVDMPSLGAVGPFQPAVVSQITYVSHSYKRQCDCMEVRGNSEIISFAIFFLT
jgi:hypothetical protein